MATAKLRMLPCLFLMLSGCAIVSERSFPTRLQHQLPETRLSSAVNLYPSGLLQLLTLTGSIDIPLLLHFERTRPPYVIGWRVVDETETYDRLEIESVTVQYEGESPESFVPKLGADDLVFKSTRHYRDINVRLYKPKLMRHDPVTVTITGTAIQRDGQQIPFCTADQFTPHSQDFVMDWYSWCAGI